MNTGVRNWRRGPSLKNLGKSGKMKDIDGMLADEAMNEIPGQCTAWRLYGTGLDNLRKDVVEVPAPGENEILVRIDADGCYSRKTEELLLKKWGNF